MIFVLLEEKDTPEAEKIINDIHKELLAGGNFEDTAIAKSQDTKTAANKGYVGFFGISTYEKVFEDTAFGIAKDRMVVLKLPKKKL